MGSGRISSTEIGGEMMGVADEKVEWENSDMDDSHVLSLHCVLCLSVCLTSRLSFTLYTNHAKG
jgi:hypothetical protein